MKKIIKLLPIIILSVLFLAGCSWEVAEEKQAFSGQGISYEFQLPKGWNKTKDYQDMFNQAAVFGGEDQKSNSSMYVLTQRKDQLDLTDFGKKTQTALEKTYGYSKDKHVYMKEFKINDFPAYKYTVFTTFDDKKVWAHLYYVETKTGFVQFVFYSADDKRYEKRSEVIDESVRTLHETKAEVVSNTNENEKNEETAEQQVIPIKGETLDFVISGCRVIENNDKEKYLIIKYETTNHTEQLITPIEWNQLVQARQADTKLEVTELPQSEKATEAESLYNRREETIEKGAQLDSVVIYKLNDRSDVTLSFSDEKFKDQDDIILPVKDY